LLSRPISTAFIIGLFERPIKIGDTVEVGNLIGTVRSIGIRASNIRTYDGAEIIVPNGNLVSNEVINWTLSDQRRRIEIPYNQLDLHLRSTDKEEKLKTTNNLHKP